MNPERKERIVVDVLNRALEPRVVEPREGFEQRILANLATAPAPRPRWRWVWAPALVAVAVLAIVIGARLVHREPAAPQVVKNTVETPKQEVAVPVQREEPQVARKHFPRNVARQAVVARAEPLPRQSVFPAAVPATSEELALMMMLQNRPGQVAVVAQDQAVDREKVQKYFETGESPLAPPAPAQNMR